MDVQLAHQFCRSNLSAKELANFSRQLDELLFPLYRMYFGWIPLPFTVLTTFLTLLYIYILYDEIRGRRVNTKCYVLLLNRTLGDILCCACFVLCSFYLLGVTGKTFRLAKIRVLGTLVGGAFWSAMVSYVSLSVLKLLAVYKPLNYRKIVTMKRCIYVIVFSWIFYVIMVVITFGSYALSTVPSLKHWSGCTRNSCPGVIIKFSYILLVLAYSFTITVFIITLIFVKKARKQSVTLQQCDRNKLPAFCKNPRFPFWKLGLSVGIFAIFNAVYIIGEALFLRTEQCIKLATKPYFVKYYSILWFCLLLRILTDTLVGIATDRKIWLRLMRITSKDASDSNTRTRAY